MPVELDYCLAETVVVIEGTIDVVTDKKLDTSGEDWGSAVTTVVLATRGDEGGGLQTVELDGGSDTDFTVELTPDRRLTSVTYKSVGVGSRLVAAATTLIATAAGIAVRVGSGATGSTRFATATESEELTAGRRTAEERIQAEWRRKNRVLASHRSKYRELLATTRKKLLAAREALVEAADAQQMADAPARIHRLTAVEAAAQAEIDKVDTLYRTWRDSFVSRRKVNKSFTISMAALPKHVPNSVPNPETLSDAAMAAWKELGVIVELGLPDGYANAVKPNRPVEADPRSRVYWRLPRPARIWVWQRGDDDAPVLLRTQHALIVDDYSDTRNMQLSERVFGEEGGALLFDGSGMATKISRNAKSALGAFADAVGAVPGSIATALDSVTKADASLTALADADATRAVEGLKREVERRTQKLELDGLDATAEDFAELKRLKQQLELTTTREALAPPTTSELARLQNELALERARRDLEATSRQRALDGELAATQAEVARLAAELRLADLRARER